MKRSMIEAFTLAHIGAIFAFCFAKSISCIYVDTVKFLAVIMRDAKHSRGARDLAPVIIKIKLFDLAF